MPTDDAKQQVSRRQFLKFSGAAGAALGVGSMGLFGYQAGKDPSSYTGWKSFEGGDQTFDRARFETNSPTYEKVGDTSRIDARTEVVFSRMGYIFRSYKDETGIEGLPQHVQAYYKAHPEDLELDLYLVRELYALQREDDKKHGDAFILAQAWSDAMAAVQPPRISEPPEVADFPKTKGDRYHRGDPDSPYKMKSPQNTSKLIKKIAHQLGGTLVGIATLNPDWVYRYPTRGRGLDTDKPLEVPKHWQSAIVVGTPMSWDPMYANPNYGTSDDAYSIARIIGFRLAAFIRKLGYAARPHTPGFSYDVAVPPIMVDAGLGEQGRHGVVITPELGCNIRPTVVTTNLPLQPDKPIDFGVQSFCSTCKVCAEQCPSGAIPKGGKTVVRGYRRWQVHAAKCHNFWSSNLGNMGCRICVAVCPYTRKANWLHKTALQVTANDPTGVSHAALTKMQKLFYPGPNPPDYYIPSLGGKNASYREPPWWLRTEDFVEL
ncbi:MAG: reductive dehalogenase [Candidatus Latescibacterota bacterium]|nr:MAG: reductive dehalogenase [Candidatus Latescibacterota bacterium]